ncbi:hypothetical protein VTI74DRAFT_10524 [Chaetomium olivicolor]
MGVNLSHGSHKLYRHASTVVSKKKTLELEGIMMGSRHLSFWVLVIDKQQFLAMELPGCCDPGGSAFQIVATDCHWYKPPRHPTRRAIKAVAAQPISLSPRLETHSCPEPAIINQPAIAALAGVTATR